MTTPQQTGYNLNDPALVSVLDEVPLWSAPFGIKLLEKIILQKNIRVLDIGYGTTMFRHFFIRVAFLGPWLGIVPENKREEIFNEIELRINRISDKEGHFRLRVPFAVIEAIKYLSKSKNKLP